MTFADLFHNRDRSLSSTCRNFLRLLDPASDDQLETLAREASMLTRRHFGRTMRLFAPLYLSNECINNCAYCGFSRDNPILRVTLSPEQVMAEARYLAGSGLRHVLLVSGEHPKFVSNGYLADVVARVRTVIPEVSLEVGPAETADYAALVAAGAEGLVVYQETYNQQVYRELHTAGPKRDFDWRLECPERAFAAGFRRLGVGALFGLSDWRTESRHLVEHVEFLLRKCWRAQVAVSLPRLRPAAGGFEPRTALTDRELLQLVCALRITFPQVGLVLSTREGGALRDALLPLGITLMSAGSCTSPGGYTGQGCESLHLTVRGRSTAPDGLGGQAEPQFAIDDDRSAGEIARVLQRIGLEPVWKDWDRALAPA
ncbi:MAG TPA: 2-iminoacetate synthase ThiH [Chthoniobacterales bacterium]